MNYKENEQLQFKKIVKKTVCVENNFLNNLTEKHVLQNKHLLWDFAVHEWCENVRHKQWCRPCKNINTCNKANDWHHNMFEFYYTTYGLHSTWLTWSCYKLNNGFFRTLQSMIDVIMSDTKQWCHPCTSLKQLHMIDSIISEIKQWCNRTSLKNV